MTEGLISFGRKAKEVRTLNICCILSWAPHYKEPNRPGVEMRWIALAAEALFRRGKIDKFYVCAMEQFKGMREVEWKMLEKILIRLGIPRDRLIIKPEADNTDRELESFQRFISNVDKGRSISALILAPEAKKGRIEKILMQLKFDAKVLWVEEICLRYGEPKVGAMIERWRSSLRFKWGRFYYGLFPLFLMQFHLIGVYKWAAGQLRHRGASH